MGKRGDTCRRGREVGMYGLEVFGDERRSVGIKWELSVILIAQMYCVCTECCMHTS